MQPRDSIQLTSGSTRGNAGGGAIPDGVPTHWGTTPPPTFPAKSAGAHPGDLIMGHVFVSYVRQDQGTVERLCRELLANGVEVWLDRESIGLGRRWEDAIRCAIKGGAFFIACFS